ncbi:GAF domain-containing protein [Pseudooceanicola antarcticus]|uniref:GAF domain-containing protein n=1 Tax=Pseudooceanicola antarcticus TaxID=1247613 RepID=A0A285HZ61_9RHOB|nr:GAF domain-containing protein [Pseudooceanicola antarcticus]PJE30331.1 GAF domain-containing protein [Pseudooceanicola antarcticus]SNY41008.1 GAF domain-containing protein [Pseudooceanicola antarcticus]
MTDTTKALADFTTALAAATTEEAAFDALCALTKATVGAKLFTVMTSDTEAMVARRAYTDDAVNYPTSGEKPITLNRWFDQVLTQQEAFVSNSLADIDTVFPDAELIGKLGCGSVVNLPLIIGGKVIATMNILHEEGYYTPERVAQIHDLLRLPATAACAVAMVLRA